MHAARMHIGTRRLLSSCSGSGSDGGGGRNQPIFIFFDNPVPSANRVLGGHATMGAMRVALARAPGQTRQNSLQKCCYWFRRWHERGKHGQALSDQGVAWGPELCHSKLNFSPAFRRIGLPGVGSDTMLRALLFALVALTTSLKLPPPAIGRRAAVCLLPACLFAPQIAEAKYRASLAEMKGYGSSPYVDQMKGT